MTGDSFAPKGLCGDCKHPLVKHVASDADPDMYRCVEPACGCARAKASDIPTG